MTSSEMVNLMVHLVAIAVGGVCFLVGAVGMAATGASDTPDHSSGDRLALGLMLFGALILLFACNKEAPV